MAAKLKIVLVHGIGPSHETDGWLNPWNEAVKSALDAAGDHSLEFEIVPLLFMKRFADAGVDSSEYIEAAGQLIGSWLKEAALQAIGLRATVSPSEMVRWTAGMVAQWAADDKLRTVLRKDLRDLIAAEKPRLVLAHSLGSLIAYDTFLNGTPRDTWSHNVRLFTFGSQINHPSILGQWRAGRLEPLKSIKHWYHLYNRNDLVFTNRVPRTFPNCTAMASKFGKWPFAHEFGPYLRHEMSVSSVWTNVAAEARGDASLRSASALSGKSMEIVAPEFFVPKGKKRTTSKALHVGVDEYSVKSMNQLFGCVNDTYAMSAAVQACGVDPEDIRLVSNERATSSGIRKRIEWLLDDAKPGDLRVLSFSGHGTRLPVYGGTGKIDSYMECLCPHDFDWSVETAVTDHEMSQYYSQLDYDVSLILVIDSCHSGGMSRDGLRRIRSADPPDDVRHRALRWSENLQMWLPREIEEIAPHIAAGSSKQASKDATRFVGIGGTTQRIGSSLAYRTLENSAYDKTRRVQKHLGPYMPLMLLACLETEFASEYVHGSVSYGAFTYAITTAMRRLSDTKSKKMTYSRLIEETQRVINVCQYDQTPQIVGPTVKRESVVPFLK